MNLLDRYVIRALLGGAALVLTVLIALGALFLFANQQDDIGVGTYSAIDALWFVLLNLPQQLYEFMPIGVMIGALLGLGALARGSELTVMRAAGVSVWRIAGSVAMAGVVLVAVAVVFAADVVELGRRGAVHSGGCALFDAFCEWANR